MTVVEKVAQLRKKIDDAILPLITSDYVFWGLPYYNNPGDTLIWEGALDMLKGCKYKCLGTCGWDDYKYVPLKTDTVILIIGGGFFGDVWRKAWNNVMDTITQYPDNPIVILPQSIYYEDEKIARSDIERLSCLKRLTICVRDQQSFNFAMNKIKKPTLLVPDLAFHCNMKKLNFFSRKEENRVLYLKRQDKEAPASEFNITGPNVEEKDWPLMSGQSSFLMRVVCNLIYITNKCFHEKSGKRIISLLYKYGNRNVVVRDGVRFISKYNTVFTTRLHVMVLSFLLNKKVYILDNSYGKVSGCYKTWLLECKNIKIYENE